MMTFAATGNCKHVVYYACQSVGQRTLHRQTRSSTRLLASTTLTNLATQRICGSLYHAHLEHPVLDPPRAPCSWPTSSTLFLSHLEHPAVDPPRAHCSCPTSSTLFLIHPEHPVLDPPRAPLTHLEHPALDQPRAPSSWPTSSTLFSTHLEHADHLEHPILDPPRAPWPTSSTLFLTSWLTVPARQRWLIALTMMWRFDFWLGVTNSFGPAGE